MHKLHLRQKLQSSRRKCQDHHRHGGASASSSSAFHTGAGAISEPSEPERDENWIPNVDWMKKKRPSSVEVKIHAAEDYAHHEQRISFLKSGRSFILSSVEGPHSTRQFGTNLHWKQYMRRLTFYAALFCNMLTEGQLDSHIIDAGEYEWLKLYHYIVTSTELIRCNG